MGSYSLLHFLLQGIFPTQGSNPSLLLCRRILLPLRDVGSPSPHFGAPRRLKNTEALSVVKKFWDTRDGTFPAVSVNKGYHSHEQ